jgi:hypothetical protein
MKALAPRIKLSSVLVSTGLTLAIVGVLTTQAQAQVSKPKDGFSGFVTVLAGVGSVESQFQTDSDNRVNSSLNSSGDRNTFFAPAFPFELAFMVSDWDTQFFAGIPFENLREGNFFQSEIGARHWFADNTRFAASILLPSFIANETWSDPFLLNAPRQETDLDTLGFKLRADNIAGSAWGLRYEYRNSEVYNEQSGQSQGLTSAQLQLLRRDADRHRLTVTYTMPLTDGWVLRPALRYILADAEGDSNSFNAIQPEVGILYDSDSFSFSADLLFETRWFDEDNPLFGKARDDSIYRATLAFGYKQPFGWENIRFEIIGSASYSDSDIDFYDSKGFFLGSGFTYAF